MEALREAGILITDGLFIERQVRDMEIVPLDLRHPISIAFEMTIEVVYRHDGVEWQAAGWVGREAPSMPDIGRWLRGCEWVVTRVPINRALPMHMALGRVMKRPPGLDRELEQWFGKGKLNPSR